MIDKIQFLRENVIVQFNAKNNWTILKGGMTGRDSGIKLEIEEKDNTLWITFSNTEEKHSIQIPLPYEQNGVVSLQQNNVKRAVSKYFIRANDTVLEYLDVIYYILCANPTGIVSNYLVKKIPFIQQVIYSFQNKNTSTIIYNLQKAINEVVNQMPLHETDMNSWAMNRRLLFIDPVFDDLKNPKDRLDYQVQKNREYFDRGWTSIGLSDGTLADKNYILTRDLRYLTPFGMKYHNPQRNLYSTLGMKGDETQLVVSETAAELAKEGVERKGWNLFTVFMDIPDVWEDQIMVDTSHLNKGINYTKRYQCFGESLVKEGDILKKGQPIAISPDDEIKTVDINADKLWVEQLIKSEVSVGGIPTSTTNIIVGYRRNLKEGTKITNTAANKGVIRFRELGYAIDPRTNEPRKIDVIVSSSSVGSRKNYSQIIEALVNNITGEKPIVIKDDFAFTSIEQLENRLEEEHLLKDGTWDCYTYAGNARTVAGTVFWGVTHDADDTTWSAHDVTKKNNKGLRVAGLKFSTVEFKALETRFGKNNPIIDEILTYAQGRDDLHEEIKILQSKLGITPNVPTVNIKDVKPVDQSEGSIVPLGYLTGTVVDETLHPEGFIIELPVKYQVVIDNKFKVESEGIPQLIETTTNKVIEFNKIYVPSANMRRSWRHENGNYGLNDVGTVLNNIVSICHRYMEEPETEAYYMMLYRSIDAYFTKIANKMSAKSGDINTYGMAVRYPSSIKGTASLSTELPKNTIEIHRSLAKILNINNDDVVLVIRFPCLGFMSTRPQKIRISDNIISKYTIRTSKNSLKSTNVDYDGDILFVASFHTPEAKEALLKEWTNPNKTCYDAIKRINNKAGKPHFKAQNLQGYNLQTFDELTEDSHAKVVKRATGVKSHTGPVIALAYNIMRVVENSRIQDNHKVNVGVELFLDKLGNSVFSQKHGTKSLHDIVIDAICETDVEQLAAKGFNRGISTILCDVIREKAGRLGINDLKNYHQQIKEKGGSNIINRIVRSENKIYFASRAQLEGCELLWHLNQPAVDIPSKLFAHNLK